jgi:serine/threonine-protein kinase
MDPDRWARVKEVFHAALECEPGRRPTFVRDACAGDEALRQTVEAMLAREPEARSFLESPAIPAGQPSRLTEGRGALSCAPTTAPPMALTAGTRLGPYEIVAALGAGGMGEVYRARDPRLEREVALKVLPAAMVADDTARARLLREARMAARLNHPHVCTIHEVGEAEGQGYVAMELVPGQALSERLSGGRMGIDEVLRLGQQMADALAHAHENGVVHRDFKSANVIVTPEGRAKVLDFGLAKPLVEAESEATTLTAAPLTAQGAVVGTLAYMAPEQLKGRRADARSDVWALGVVLYEMASGVRPFAGKTGYELSSAILNHPPPPLPADVPPPLAAVIERCLAKDPGQRYPRAGEVRSALETLRAGGRTKASLGRRTALLARRRWVLLASLATVAAVVAAVAALDVGGVRGRLLRRAFGPGAAIRMAVLPFANLTGDPEQEYLSDGLTQELISQLGRMHPQGLSVIARTSVMRYKKADTPIDQIGRELGVGYVLEGSARREGGTIRITAELVHVTDQAQLWAETYERELSGLLALESEVAGAVARALALKLLPAEQARLATTRTVDAGAYDAYLKGSYHWKKLVPGDLDIAERYFELALSKDRSYAPAHEGLAWVWAARQQMGFVPPSEAGPKAKAAALEAIALDGDSADAHEALAIVRTWIDWDWVGAEPEWRRALGINPNAANAHAYFAHYLAIVGRVDEALPHSERALALDPFNALFHGLYAAVLYFDRRHDDAILEARRALDLQADQPVALNLLWLAAARSGRHGEALAGMKAYLHVLYQDASVEKALEEGGAEGGYAEARRRATRALMERYRRAYVLPTDIATMFADAGEHDAALDWLDQAFEVRDPTMPYLGMPVFDSVRSEPRFQGLLRRMNLPPQPSAKDLRPTGVKP